MSSKISKKIDNKIEKFVKSIVKIIIEDMKKHYPEVDYLSLQQELNSEEKNENEEEITETK